MAYVSGCDCSYGQILVRPSRCIACPQLPSDAGIGGVYTAHAEQQRIWKTVGVPSSIYTMNLASLTVPNGTANKPQSQYNFVNWNQLSDRAVPSIQRVCVPTRGNSTRSSITAARPGACAPCGKGVDIKHDSYARYLAKKKAGHLKPNCVSCKDVVSVKSSDKCPSAYPYPVETGAYVNAKLCYTKEEYAKQGWGPAWSWCALNPEDHSINIQIGIDGVPCKDVVNAE